MKRTILSLALAAVTLTAVSGLASANYSDTMLWDGLFRLADTMNFATPDIEDPTTEGTLTDAIILTQWKADFMNFLGAELSHTQCYEVARQVGFRVQRVDPNNSLQDAVIYTRWLGAFKRYLAERADFEETVVALLEVTYVGV